MGGGETKVDRCPREVGWLCSKRKPIPENREPSIKKFQIDEAVRLYDSVGHHRYPRALRDGKRRGN